MKVHLSNQTNPPSFPLQIFYENPFQRNPNPSSEKIHLPNLKHKPSSLVLLTKQRRGLRRHPTWSGRLGPDSTRLLLSSSLSLIPNFKTLLGIELNLSLCYLQTNPISVKVSLWLSLKFTLINYIGLFIHPSFSLAIFRNSSTQLMYLFPEVEPSCWFGYLTLILKSL